MKLVSAHLYPVKSLRGVDVARATVEARGLRGDRRYMLIDAAARFVTARQHPRLLLVTATLVAAGLRLELPDGDARDVAVPALTQPCIDVGIWRSHSPARVVDDAINAWLSRHLGIEVRLVHMANDCVRTVSREWSSALPTPGDIVSFADGFPLLLIGTASLDLLNSKLARPVTMANFRPNLVVQTDTAHVEDDWRRIRIGDCEFAVCKPCTRCVLTTIDPANALRAANGEPLTTLKTYRREAIGVTFGQNLLVRHIGDIATGMKVEVLE